MSLFDSNNDQDVVALYKTICEKMGPSEQLMAFINNDGNLGDELGIGNESFDSLSLQARHEILLSKLIKLD